MAHSLRLALFFMSVLTVCVQWPQRRSFLLTGLRIDGNFKHGKIEKWPTVEPIVQNTHDSFLCLDQLCHGQFPMCDLLVDRPHLQREDLLHLTGYQHALHTHQMQLRGREALWLSLEVSIHQRNTVEICFWTKSVRRGDLYHPVQHAGTKETIDIMPA